MSHEKHCLGDDDVDDVIKDLLKASPGLSSERILKLVEHRLAMTIFPSQVYKCLRVLKRKGVLINNRNSWYINERRQVTRKAKVSSGG